MERNLNLVETAIEGKSCMYLILEDGTSEDIYPHRVVFLEGALAVVSESLADGRLFSFYLHDINNLDVKEGTKEKHYSDVEIDDYIVQIRQMNEKQIRLIIKIYPSHNFKVDLPYQFFESPYMVTNPEGNCIWAVTMEPNEAIFNWLYEQKDFIEILDPEEFRESFFNYCNQIEDSKKVA